MGWFELFVVFAVGWGSGLATAIWAIERDRRVDARNSRRRNTPPVEPAP